MVTMMVMVMVMVMVTVMMTMMVAEVVALVGVEDESHRRSARGGSRSSHRAPPLLPRGQGASSHDPLPEAQRTPEFADGSEEGHICR